MVASDISQFYLELRAELIKLLLLAQEEAVDGLVDALPHYNAMVERLPQIDWTQLNRAQVDALAALLREIQALQAELTRQSESWRDQIADKLQSLHNADKLGKAYR